VERPIATVSHVWTTCRCPLQCTASSRCGSLFQVFSHRLPSDCSPEGRLQTAVSLSRSKIVFENTKNCHSELSRRLSDSQRKDKLKISDSKRPKIAR